VGHTINAQLLNNSARNMLGTDSLRQDMTAVFHCRDSCNFLAIPHTRTETVSINEQEDESIVYDI
jgi:hypothetical protein